MRSPTALLSVSLLGASAAVFAAYRAPAAPPPSSVDLQCKFETVEVQEGSLECSAKLSLKDIHQLAAADTDMSGNTVNIRCENGFRLSDKRNVKAKLNDDLEVFAREDGESAKILVRDFTGEANTKFRAKLVLGLRHGQEDFKVLQGHCKTASSPVPPQGSCRPSSSLSVLVSGTNVVSYVPKGSWSGGSTGVSVVNIEGTSVTPTLIPTTNVVNSCASNSVTGQTVCTANNADVYLLSGTTLNSTLTSAGTSTISFSGGSCTNCGVAMDAVHNKAVIGLSIAGSAGFQYLNLAGTPAFETAFPSPAGSISEDPLIDPVRNLLLSPSESGNYELVNVATTTSPTFFENATGGGELDSAAEDCTTGIAFAPAEFSDPSNVFVTDLTQATLTPGTPAGTWTAPSQIQTLTESSLSAGASGMAVAQGTHTGLVTGEFGGNALTAISLPATSGSGTPAISDWVTCSISGFSMGRDPHTVTAYQSPNSGNAIALLTNGGATSLAVVDLTQMLNPTIVPRTPGGHACASGTLPAGVVTLIPVL